VGGRLASRRELKDSAMLPALPALARAETIDQALQNDAHVVFSLSGGKDSSAAAFATMAYLDAIGHPRDRRHAIHADLGPIEWPSTPPFVEQVADRLGTPLHVVRRKAGGLIERWRQRWASSQRRYIDLLTYQLVTPFSGASLRFCTSETKVAPIGAHLRSKFAGETIVSVVGIRRQESAGRAAAPVWKADTRFAPPANRAGTRMLTWHPILDWTEEQIYAAHAAAGFPLHEAYGMGATRLSCSFCVLASLHNLAISASAPGNQNAYREIADIELASGFSFQPARWLADVRPDLLSPEQLRRLPEAKALAELRRSAEASLPADLRFCRGWPPRVPTYPEAERIADVRGRLHDALRLTNRFPTAGAIRDRFAELHAVHAS